MTSRVSRETFHKAPEASRRGFATDEAGSATLPGTSGYLFSDAGFSGSWLPGFIAAA